MITGGFSVARRIGVALVALWSAAVPAVAAGRGADLTPLRAVIAAASSPADGERQAGRVEVLLDRIANDYVDPVREADLVDAAVTAVREAPFGTKPEKLGSMAAQAVTGRLDPHTGYMDRESFRALQGTTRGEFGGIGLELSRESPAEGIRVLSPIDGTPAARAGFKTGDIIVGIDGTAAAELSLTDAVLRMRGAPGTQLRLTVRRQPAGEFDVVLQRAIVRIEPVTWRMEGDIGFIRIASFTDRTGQGVRDALAALRRRGPLAGLVLDLRNNPGGILEQAVTVSDDFLDQGGIVSLRGRGGKETQRFDAVRGDIARGLPVAVLINKGSASAAEIVAGALQDNRRAILVGEPTFGKGSVQTLIPLSDGGGLRLTTGRYHTPSGLSPAPGKSVAPDLAAAGEVADSGADPALGEALRALGPGGRHARGH